MLRRFSEQLSIRNHGNSMRDGWTDWQMLHAIKNYVTVFINKSKCIGWDFDNQLKNIFNTIVYMYFPRVNILKSGTSCIINIYGKYIGVTMTKTIIHPPPPPTALIHKYNVVSTFIACIQIIRVFSMFLVVYTSG